MVVFMTTLNKEAWQSVSRGSGVLSFWKESQCKNAKVNKEWLLLRNRRRERACKVGSVAREREEKVGLIQLGKDTRWWPGWMDSQTACACLVNSSEWEKWTAENCLAFLCKQEHGDSLRRWRMMFFYHHKCKVTDKIIMRLPLVQETWCQMLLIIVTRCECGCTDEKPSTAMKEQRLFPVVKREPGDSSHSLA